jgi:hypothetical protein
MDDDKLIYIANLVEEGYTSGIDPTWSITIEEDEEDEAVRLHEIARLIKEGYMSGFEPTWSIEIK